MVRLETAPTGLGENRDYRFKYLNFMKPRLPSEGIYQDSNTGFNNLAIVFYDDIITIYLDGIRRDT